MGAKIFSSFSLGSEKYITKRTQENVQALEQVVQEQLEDQHSP